MQEQIKCPKCGEVIALHNTTSCVNPIMQGCIPLPVELTTTTVGEYVCPTCKTRVETQETHWYIRGA